ncbi:DAK2 domain-containing protein [Mycoplasma sp. CSL10137]|uniref:DAK2 domain-containing protein n=1 Tax=unclassified Mycoplasma TaxID=2683645 RepID=UPI00197B44B9|nr:MULTISPECIES: DAK2 domain-containing protein [unclassified Mycoplasma]MBN4083770.1 DAK2 domain-containing protein [Mycoplasma sp. CSL10137]MBU4692637.1 DAK2 domain-containing protein [Mycoplasma sp. CSL7491-lung]
MSKKTINLTGYEFAQAIISGATALQNAKNQIDAMNVFPVPDGDTGTNMSSTAYGAIELLNSYDKNIDIATVTKELAHSMLFAARGNSGVILSQIFKGFAEACKNKKTLNLDSLLKAFRGATEAAYKSVFKPVEGTMLTVIRETTEDLEREFYRFDSSRVTINEFWSKLLKFMRESCDETPNKLKTLREVGVTDSGGEGLFKIFWGVNEYFNGRPVKLEENENVNVFLSSEEVYNGEFGYCTEVLVDLDKPKDFDKESFTKKLEMIANSLVVVNDDNILKVHGHTVKPGDMLNFVQEFGEFIKIKSENMTLQANGSRENAKVIKSNLENSKRNLCGVVSCNLGSGIIQRMKDLGTDFVVESGQTQNPSAQDLINAINSVNADTVFILPNNSNVILVAQQAAQVVRDKNIIVIPTKTQIQGLSAILNFNPETSAEDNKELMEESIELVSTGEITKAVRNTKINGIKVKVDDYLTILNGRIVNSSKNITNSLRDLVSRMIQDDSQLVSIYYGEDGNINEANELSNYIESNYEVEVQVIDGSQPNYSYLIGVE